VGRIQGQLAQEPINYDSTDHSLLSSIYLFSVVKSMRSFNVDTGKTWITPHTASLLWPTVLQHSDGNTTM